MKDKFFQFVNNIYLWIYSFVNGTVYYIFSKRRTKNLPNLTQSEKKDIKGYWKKYKNVNSSIHEYKWFKANGKLDKRIIPESIWHADIEPHFNNVLLAKAFEDKNYYEMIIGKKNSPETIIHCINGQLLNKDYSPIDEEQVVKYINSEDEVICKASLGTCGGKSIKFISEPVDVTKIRKLIESYEGNFLIQKIVNQHQLLARFNESSVNTMRLITFLYKGKVHYIYGKLRFGSDGTRIDNSVAGGGWVLIDKDGIIKNTFYRFDKLTTDIFVNKDYVLPVNDGTKIPNWSNVLELLEQTHYKLAHFGIIYWDVSILADETPIIIEYNLLDSDAYAYQYGVGPFFGNMTEEVLSEIYL